MSRYSLPSDQRVSAITVETLRENMAAPLGLNIDIKAPGVDQPSN